MMTSKKLVSRLCTAFLSTTFVIGICAQAATESSKMTGTVSRYLLNPAGEVDGFLLKDGTQVNFPPHMSEVLAAAVSPDDEVAVAGMKENKNVFKAESVTNVKTKNTVTETPPTKADGPRAKGPKMLENLPQLSAEGKIEKQLFGPRGEVNGVILGDGVIVRFSPRLVEKSQVKMTVGQNLKASGKGTKNARGQAFEAMELAN